MATIVTRSGKGSPLTHGEVDANFTNLGYAFSDAAIQTSTPASGDTVIISNGTGCLILKHTATIAALTVTMPASPVNGQTVYLSTRSTVTALTVNGNTGQTLYGAPSTISATSSIKFVYEVATTSWYRF